MTGWFPTRIHTALARVLTLSRLRTQRVDDYDRRLRLRTLHLRPLDTSLPKDLHVAEGITHVVSHPDVNWYPRQASNLQPPG